MFLSITVPGFTISRPVKAEGIVTLTPDNTALSVGESVYFKYDFKLPVNSTLETAGWQITDCNGSNNSSWGNLPYRHQPYGIQVDTRGVGLYIAFDIKVPKEGYYDFTFNGANHYNGALSTLSIDGYVIGDYNFYAAVYTANGAISAYGPMLLSEGVHSFVVSVKQKGLKYWNMYPGELKLTERSDMPEISSLKLTAEYDSIEAGATSQLAVTGVTSGGQEIGLNGVLKTFTSDAESIATVNSQGMVTGLAKGTANIKASITIGNEVIEVVKPIMITGVISSVLYDFKDGITSTIENNGWRVEDSNASYRNQLYGIQVQSNNIDDYITMAINVPVSGYYTLKFVGAGSGGGAIADLTLDNNYVGQIDFYSAVYTAAQPAILLKTLLLNQGIHLFTIKVADKSLSWGYNMYPGELELVRQESLPTLEAVKLHVLLNT